jgi:hypothetical protein
MTASCVRRAVAWRSRRAAYSRRAAVSHAGRSRRNRCTSALLHRRPRSRRSATAMFSRAAAAAGFNGFTASADPLGCLLMLHILAPGTDSFAPILRYAQPRALTARFRAHPAPLQAGPHVRCAAVRAHHIIGELAILEHDQPATVPRQAACTNSVFIRPNRSRRSTTTITTRGSASTHFHSLSLSRPPAVADPAARPRKRSDRVWPREARRFGDR